MLRCVHKTSVFLLSFFVMSGLAPSGFWKIGTVSVPLVDRTFESQNAFPKANDVSTSFLLLLVTSATLVVTGALLVVTKSY